MVALAIQLIRSVILNYLGGYLMKKFLINWILPAVIEMAISALKRLASKSDNQIDDAMVDVLAENEQKIIDEIKASL